MRKKTENCRGGSDERRVAGTKEWADVNVNIQVGCEHDCLYCYAHEQIDRTQHSRVEGLWTIPRLCPAKVKKGYRLRRHPDGSLKTLMFPTSHDITPRNVAECITVLKKLAQAGNRILIVSKPHLECVARLCSELEPYKSQIVVRFTVGSANDDVLRFWEPGAPSYEERIASLRCAHAAGFETSVSSEPMLDDDIHAVINDTRLYVTESIWLGKANHLRQRVARNCTGELRLEALRRADELSGIQNDGKIIALYARYRNDPLIAWKDSIKKVVGIDRNGIAGLDE